MSSEWSEGTLAPGAETRPEAVDKAMKLMYLGAALGVISLIFGLSDRAEIETQVRQSLQEAGLVVNDETVAAGVVVAIVTSVLLGLVGIVLWLLMARFNGKGRMWARTVATILGSISIVVGVVGLAGIGITGFTLGHVLTLITMALAGTILYFLWRPENAPFYAYNSQRSPR